MQDTVGKFFIINKKISCTFNFQMVYYFCFCKSLLIFCRSGAMKREIADTFVTLVEYA